jgi:hypothetical protein
MRALAESVTSLVALSAPDTVPVRGLREVLT